MSNRQLKKNVDPKANKPPCLIGCNMQYPDIFYNFFNKKYQAIESKDMVKTKNLEYENSS